MKTTRAWVLLKGLVVILIFLLLAYFFRMTTILWMAQNVLGFAVTALIVVLQPELRKALEELGKKNGWLLYPLGIALSGKQRTPGGGTDLACMMGREKTLQRVQDAIAKLNG